LDYFVLAFLSEFDKQIASELSREMGAYSYYNEDSTNILTEVSVKRVINREKAKIFHDLLIADNLKNG